MHIDPHYTDAFNGLLQGKKWWVSMPKDLYEFSDEMTCLEICSANENDAINPYNQMKLWMSHMLPQLRSVIVH